MSVNVILSGNKCFCFPVSRTGKIIFENFAEIYVKLFIYKKNVYLNTYLQKNLHIHMYYSLHECLDNKLNIFKIKYKMYLYISYSNY